MDICITNLPPVPPQEYLPYEITPFALPSHSQLYDNAQFFDISPLLHTNLWPMLDAKTGYQLRERNKLLRHEIDRTFAG